MFAHNAQLVHTFESYLGDSLMGTKLPVNLTRLKI